MFLAAVAMTVAAAAQVRVATPNTELILKA